MQGEADVAARSGTRYVSFRIIVTFCSIINQPFLLEIGSRRLTFAQQNAYESKLWQNFVPIVFDLTCCMYLKINTVKISCSADW